MAPATSRLKPRKAGPQTLCGIHPAAKHTSAVYILDWGVWGGFDSGAVGFGGQSAEKKKGDKRTGPALNPLKGSSARVPHTLWGANRTPFLNPSVSSYCCTNPRKNVPPPAKIYPSPKPPTGFTVSPLGAYSVRSPRLRVDPTNAPLLS